MINWESKSLANASISSVPDRRSPRPSTSLGSFISRLRRGPTHRAKLLSSNLNRELAYQLRRLRDKKGWSQPELAKRMRTSQNAISRLENPAYGKASLSTLKKLAAIFDVALEVRFVPFSKWANWQSSVGYWEMGLSPESNNPKTFDEEEKDGTLRKAESPAPLATVQIGFSSYQRPSFGRSNLFYGIHPTVVTKTTEATFAIEGDLIGYSLESGVYLDNIIDTTNLDFAPALLAQPAQSHQQI
jgi:transcriptional regulator with XRE-family HTH domain